jgi:pimeloyl-ACP methyl ester carboxylesterase
VGGLIFIDYDRANIGSSDAAPTPRTAAGVVSDLHQLLETADVPGPYVLVGYGNGGFFVQLYGRRYSDEVEGVVVMNPVAPAHPWLERALPLFDEQVRAEERAYYRGNNDEHIDWLASSKQLENAPQPPSVPFEMLISTERECLSMPEGRQPCLESHEVYEQVTREVTQQWPESSYR